MTERSDIHKYSFVIRHSSISACPGWVSGTGIGEFFPIFVFHYTKIYKIFADFR